MLFIHDLQLVINVHPVDREAQIVSSGIVALSEVVNKNDHF